MNAAQTAKLTQGAARRLNTLRERLTSRTQAHPVTAGFLAAALMALLAIGSGLWPTAALAFLPFALWRKPPLWPFLTAGLLLMTWLLIG